MYLKRCILKSIYRDKQCRRMRVHDRRRECTLNALALKAAAYAYCAGEEDAQRPVARRYREEHAQASG